jgi:apolipoprotein N-acyltransferase
MGRFLSQRTTLWSLLSGLLLSLSFHPLDLAAAAWFAFIPLFLVMHRRPFRSGFAAGVGFFAPVLYWLNIVMTTYGRMHPFFSLAAYLMLVCYLALFFGAVTWAACRLREKSGHSVLLTLPVLWVALEFLRSFLLSGFPWASLGYSQQSLLTFIQSADLLGVYGLSFLLILVNAVLAVSCRALWRRDFDALPRRAMTVALLLFAANLGYGFLRLSPEIDVREKTLRTVLVQGNIDQAVKWDPAYQRTTIDTYFDLSFKAARQGPVDLIIWPESATPFYFQEDGPLSDLVEAIPRRTGAHLLFGSPAYELANKRYSYLNSAFLLSGQSRVLGRSDKIHLVPFGEYVPLGPFLPFIDKLVTGIGDFTPGTVSPLPLNGAEIGVLVCYEAIFPELAREWVRRGSDLLVNITNDAWFGRSSAPWQHLGMTRFRAIENRIWIARAANTGISAFIAPSGRVIASTPLFETLFLQGEVGLGARPTLYTRIGDVVPTFFLILGIWWLVQTRRRLGKEAVTRHA